MTASDLAGLVAALPNATVITEDAQLESYRWDRAFDPEAVLPLAVVRASNTADVQGAVRFATANGIGVVPRGAGSGLSGGSSARERHLVISLEDMTAIDVDPVTRMAVVQPGALNAHVKKAAREHGLWYPPDPASFEFCSIGGNVATNAGGLCCVKYGVTKDYVLGLTVVVADGRAITLGGPRIKDVAGLSLTQLFVGSEGTLGVITEIVLRLVPAQRPTTTLVTTFGDLASSVAAVVEIARLARPSMLEFMDAPCIRAVEDWLELGLDRDAAAMLVVQSDESGAAREREIALIREICESYGGSIVVATDDPELAETYVAARRVAIPAVERTGTVLLCDLGVPIPRLGDLVLGMDAIAREQGITIAVLAHAGDGNTHPLLVFDAEDATQTEHAYVAYAELMRLAIDLGGTITGEHGVGRLKRAWLTDQIGEDAMDLNRRIKAALDPTGLFNPGSVF